MLGKPERAAADATAVLRLDDNNVKALYRRSRARRALQQHAAAVQDLEWVLKLDPSNKAATTDINKARAAAAEAARPKPKRVLIQEVESESESEDESVSIYS
eukprot:UC1_evm2s761